MKTVLERLLAASYDHLLARTERQFLGRWRRELLATARGDLLEIGAGTGLNLPHYDLSTTRPVLSEPDPYMRQQLQRKISRAGAPVRVTAWQAEAIAMPDESFDTIVSTLVLCSVTDLHASLREISRLLRPGGQLLFLEHIASDQPATRRWQRRIEPAWKFCAGNCHLTRDTRTAMEACGLQLRTVTEELMPAIPAIFRRTIRGAACKTA